MRLIDADAFIEYLGLDAEDAREVNLGAAVSLEDFDRQPTAYDVGKVMERLKEDAKKYEEPVSSDGGFRRFCRGIATGFRYAMGIVEGGGMDEL